MILGSSQPILIVTALSTCRIVPGRRLPTKSSKRDLSIVLTCSSMMMERLFIPCTAPTLTWVGRCALACRDAQRQMWWQARWLNGMDAVRMVSEEGKTIVCGHWHTSYGYSKYEGKGSELGADADFSPYSTSGIIALDACTARSGIVNCIVVEDDELQ